MKTIKLLLSGLLFLTPFLGNSQEWDDIYANPDKQGTRLIQEKPQKPEKKQAIVVLQGDASKVSVEANGRDIDAYNRRGGSEDVVTGQATVDEYTDYEYTDRIIKYHDPESSVKITGVDEVTIYVGDDLYSEYYENRGYNYNVNIGWGWGGYYPWYDSWHYYYYGWHSPWNYRYGFGYTGFYDPFLSPWGWYVYPNFYTYSSWYGGRYYVGYGGYYGGYGGYGYGYGFNDGYYAGLSSSRSGRSPASYRGGNYGRSTASRSAVAGRGSITDIDRTSASGRASRDYSRTSRTSTASASNRTGVTSGRSGTSSSRTRIVDRTGNVLDSRTGRTISRVNATDRTGRVNATTARTSRGSSVGRTGTSDGSVNRAANSRTSSRVYQRSSSGIESSRGSAVNSGTTSRGTVNRGVSSSTRSSGIYSTPSRTNRTGTYSPTRTTTTRGQTSSPSRSSTIQSSSRSSSVSSSSSRSSTSSSTSSSSRSSGGSSRSSGGGRR